MLQPVTVDLLDVSAHRAGQTNRLTRIYRASSGATIRVTVHRDFYAEQSRAVAEVLTPALTWTELVDASPAYWYADAKPQADLDAVAAQLGWVADELLDRALRVLHP